MKTVIFIHEAVQVERLPELLKKVGSTKKYDLIACGADIEFLLEEKKIPYRSARELRHVSPIDRLVAAKAVGDQIFGGDNLSFFSHRGIHLGTLFKPALQYYLAHFFYYLDIVSSTIEEGCAKIILFDISPEEPPAASVLERFHTQSVSDAIKLVSRVSNVEIEIIKILGPLTASKSKRYLFFTFKKYLFSIFLSVVNLFVTLIVRKRKVRILASEYWKNIQPFMEELRGAEIVLLDRAESMKMGIKAVLRHRARFIHIESFVRSSDKRQARDTVERWREVWNAAQKKILEEVSFKGYSLASVLDPVILHLLRESRKLMLDIDGTFNMLSILLPDVVMVRASISTQTHFAVLCEVARMQNIPSIEIQHGILSSFEGDFTNNPSSEYVAEYGPIVREELEKHSYAPRSRFVDIGSPRFDVYIADHSNVEKQSKKEFSILHFAPAYAPGSWNDTYDVVDYYRSLAEGVREISNVKLTLKLRPGRMGEVFLREVIRRVFNDIPHTIAQFEPLHELLAATDVVVSYHSTALLEALLSHTPVIYDATLPIYARLAEVDLKRHTEAGALVVVKTQQELHEALLRLSTSKEAREEISRKAEEFMRTHYLLHDGEASKRLTDLVQSLAATKE